jgi:6-phosphogluconate dehydrogenase (decarboxylating)
MPDGPVFLRLDGKALTGLWQLGTIMNIRSVRGIGECYGRNERLTAKGGVSAVENNSLKLFIAALSAACVLWLAYLAIDRGPAELVALAAVLSAGATLLSNFTYRDK